MANPFEPPVDPNDHPGNSSFTGNSSRPAALYTATASYDPENPGSLKNVPQTQQFVRFDNETGQWNDVWAAILFLMQALAVEVLAIALGAHGISISSLEHALHIESGNTTTISPPPLPPPPSSSPHYDFADWAPQLAAAAGAGVVFSILWLQLLKLMPRTMVRVSLWWSILMSFGLGIFLLIKGQDAKFYGFVFIGLGLLNMLYAFLVRNRIPFAAAMISQVVSIIRVFPSTLWTAYLGLLCTLIWVAIWMLGVVGAMSLHNSAVIIVGLLLSLYWTAEVIRNTVHVTNCGTVGTYYFQRLSMPTNPTGRSLTRALTKSFGSICLGSLIVAVLQTLQALINMAVQAALENDEGNICCLFMASCLQCLIGLLESMVAYFNKWAYAQIAIYGKPFVRAAKDTWDLFKARGLDALINDDLTSGVLLMGAFLGGLIGATVGGLLTLGKDENLLVGVAAISFFIAFSLTIVPLSVIESGTVTYFVCFAEDPAALQRNDPSFYEVLVSRQQALIGM